MFSVSRVKGCMAMCPFFTAPKPRSLIFFFSVLLWTGCSTLTHYPDEMANALQDYEVGELEKAYRAVEKKTRGGLDQLTYTLESALIKHTEGELEESNKIFSLAEQHIRQQEEKAVISVSRTAGQGASILVNEKTIPYSGEPFEKVLVHAYKALNYLMLRQYEDARVEVRRVYARQIENRERHKKELEQVENEAREKGVRPEEYFPQISSYYADQSRIGGRVANLYEDAFAYYLSALVYEMNGEYNDAHIDLKKVQSLRPGIPWVENDLLRTAKRAGIYDEYNRWEKSLGRKVQEPRQNDGEIILFFECGMAPCKTQLKIPLFIPDIGVVSLAFPKYELLPNRIDRAALFHEDGTCLGRTTSLTDIEAIAIRNLQDRMSILVIKQILRTLAKGTVAMVALDQQGSAGVAGAVLSSIYNVVTEQADLRSWLTLPQNIQAVRVTIPSGTQQLVLCLESHGGMCIEKRPFSVQVKPGRFLFLDARCSTTNLIAFHIQ